MSTAILQPTSSSERIQALDFLRGFAILGILIINIQSFAMPGAAYLNPMAYGDMSGANRWVWLLSHIFGDQKFMTIFSILYGAGIVLVTQSAEEKSGRSAGLHYRRTFWLLIIGLLHAHIIWYGDILVPYALCALFAYLFRKAKPVKLMIVGTVLIAVHTVIYVMAGLSMDYWPPESIIALRESWIPDTITIQNEIAAITGTYAEQLSKNSSSAIFMETGVFLFLFLWRAGGLMLVGMALYKWGVLTAGRSSGFYRRGLIIGWAIGFSLVIYGVYRNFQANFALEYSMYLGSQFNYWGSAFVSFGYICGIMLIARSNALGWLKDRLAAVGQMALTNYIAQSILCTLVFYGIGFGLFGRLERKEQLIAVVAVWILQVIWSGPWLHRFRFGPLEWMWRSLTYMKMQPFRK